MSLLLDQGAGAPPFDSADNRIDRLTYKHDSDPLDICFIGTYPPTLCGVATFGASLRNAIASPLGGVIRVLDEPEPTRSPEVMVEWFTGDRTSKNKALAAMRSFDVAILQHEFGIYGGEDGEEVIGFLRDSPIPVIMVLHTVLSDPSPHQRQVFERAIEAADMLVTMTDAARRRVVDRHGVDPARVAVVPHGAHPNIVGGRMVRRPEPVVLTWGLIGPGKGLEYGVEAMASLVDLDPAPVYVIAGQTHPKVRLAQGGRYRGWLQQRAQDIGVSDRVIFEDRYLDPASLRSLIRSADLVLLPYKSRDQICSGVLAEAVAAGKPIVASAFPHAIEQLSSACGIVVPHEDPAAIARALRRLMTDRPLADSMRNSAMREAQRLAWPNVGREYLRLAHGLRAGRESVR